uniref:Uncharacterized protein n=1 Tax=Ditylenchus dipsaci TaxID=166011 RepID=A0A915E840_9BILA
MFRWCRSTPNSDVQSAQASLHIGKQVRLLFYCQSNGYALLHQQHQQPQPKNCTQEERHTPACPPPNNCSPACEKTGEKKKRQTFAAYSQLKLVPFRHTHSLHSRPDIQRQAREGQGHRLDRCTYYKLLLLSSSRAGDRRQLKFVCMETPTLP